MRNERANVLPGQFGTRMNAHDLKAREFADVQIRFNTSQLPDASNVLDVNNFTVINIEIDDRREKTQNKLRFFAGPFDLVRMRLR